MLFPNHCMICKSISIKANGKKQFAKNTLTHIVDFCVKDAVEKCNDEKMLTDITGKDLIAKEFKKYEKCYQDYTQILYEKDPQKKQIYEKFDYEKVCSTTEEQVIRSNVCTFMKVIMENYGIGQGQHQYKSKLKNQLIKTFHDKTLFLTPENNIQVIISRNYLPGQPVLSILSVLLLSYHKKIFSKKLLI